MQEKTFALSRRALLRTAAVGAAATAATATIPSVVMAADGVAADTSKIRNFDMIEAFYREYPKKLAVVRGTLNRPLTLTEKILFTHLYHPESLREFKRGVDYIELRPDRAGTHDIGGPMAIIQFLSSGKERIALPAALVCDHLVQANVGAIPDLKVAEKGNVETYEFLRDVSRRYGFDFWPAGSGICHQVFMENYNFPGCMMLVTDSHTPAACGMGMLAIGVGGADLVDALMGMEWELKMPKIIGVKLTGQLQGWASAKDVILKLTEGVAKMLLGMLKQMFLANFGGKIAYLLLKGGVSDLKHQMDSEEYGGAPFLGAKQPVIKAHGSSKAKGIKNAIRQAKTCVENDLCGTMQSALDELAAANKSEE